MSFRNFSVLFAACYVLVHSYLIYSHGLSLKFWLDMREVIDVLAIIAVCAVIAGASAWWLAGAMLLAAIWIFPTAVPIVQGMFLGVWSYSRYDAGIFSLIFLPPLSLAMALLADGGWRYLKKDIFPVDEQVH